MNIFVSCTKEDTSSYPILITLRISGTLIYEILHKTPNTCLLVMALFVVLVILVLSVKSLRLNDSIILTLK